MHNVQNYKQADSLLQGRCRESRKLANNTYLERRVDQNNPTINGDSFAVRLHATDIVTYKPDGTIVLNSGGWRTVTTKERINTFSPVNLWQEKGVWYLGKWSAKKLDRIIYADKMTVDEAGFPANPIIELKTDRTERKKLLKQIKDYAKLCADSCPIPQPSNGDCWGCLFVDKETKQPAMGKDHYLQHFKEGYVVPSLVYRACIQYAISAIAGSYLTEENSDSWMADIGKRQIESAVYRFVKQQFGLAS
ncbi:hypothetical protein KAR91_21255 [Candidatus Pacearchaeota archaeon]|nr:hypothetical protein [Candidatus Pacearchaeota archaeon]